MSYSQQPTLWLPDLHGQMCGHSVLLLVANNELKDALTQILDGHQRVINGRYDVMAGTTGTFICRYETNALTELSRNVACLTSKHLPHGLLTHCRGRGIHSATIWDTPGHKLCRNFRQCRRCLCPQISYRTVWDSRQGILIHQGV